MEIQVIGQARTAWSRRQDAPHQPRAAAEVVGEILVEEPFRAALADLESFNRIWVIFLFHQSTGFAPRVKPPRGGPKRGVLATRAPNRPSQIGLSCVELVAVDVSSGVVRAAGLDLLNETPVLDLKPYLPEVDSFPEAGHGWLDAFRAAGIEPRLKKPFQPPRSK
ncbi:MAG: tRNA (N6-threonylcarbamoyladenosine(37)-N6)-methyltransferase TrmO [Candidatus Binatia bacterium]|nr:tRNA (N6-threonylcarbamoyladenosine(37)-N6)-methyltransferase TrmO [Candidatus Binatia bacterium]